MGREAQSYDWIIGILLILLCVIGLFLLLTIDYNLFQQQFLFFGLGICVYLILSRIHHLYLIWSAPLAYIVGLLFLLLSYLGPTIRGASRWIVVFGYQLQPSEIVKPFFLLFFAWLIEKFPPRQAKYVPLHLLAFLIPFLLIFKQPDLGTSIVYASMWISMLIAAGLSLKLLVGAIISQILILPLIWQFLVQYQKLRILTFLNPALDPKGAGYNALQAMIAVGSGRLTGRGLGRGTQSHLRFLPEFHTDFIFATLIEELGFLGGMVLLFCYAFLLYRILTAAWKNSDSLFAFVFSIGLFTMLMTQLFINSGMNMGIVPITGITLPLVSYGGSSLLSLAISFALFHALTRPQT
ncbi:hypothetical protein A2154_02045 [Candidatus Gottesmanbacteria bacterium RBG_16_43_7]|uniref:Rod shape-determining protein RodA n=1 Tax=Candidatus Gottesmanbacteria bacterium RBG_16_43_7 TaxID=1798373 RepID=A0A1F5Z878_9BACT|nr:MAG: hypothetical protein A2154_02045 [Candidatus Gottesmanbacteria bacterium RBG_16_43_7]